MHRYVMFRVLLLGVLVAMGPSLIPHSSLQAAGELTVTVTYKGKVPVDATHALLVFLFDNPNIGPDSRPLTFRTITKNGGAASFTDVTTTPVYIAVVQDEKANYNGRSGPPPPGTPIAYYSTNKKGEPASPVTPGPRAKVKIVFDDSRRM